jgi:alpha-glucoside transport system substrate-binding protein
MKKASWKWLLSLLAIAMVAASCSGDEATTTTEGEEATATTEATEDDTTTTEAMEEVVDLAGTQVTVFGPESSDEEAGAIIDALALFTADTGIEVTYTGARDFSDQINAQVAGGNAPDIAIYPQPGKVADFAREGFILPVPDAVVGATAWDAAFLGFGNVDGVQYGMPNKADLKSLVWYKPKSFADKGYTVPETYTEFSDMVETMAAAGDTPLCVGIESGPATGWTFTDWTEEMVLRFEGGDVYDQWVNHDIPFNDPRIVAQMQAVIDLWDENSGITTFASEGSIATTPFGANGEPLVNGDCMMHRQASFYAAFIPEGTAFADGSDDAVYVFYFPAETGKPVLGAGTLAAAHNDRPEVWAVMEYFGSVQYADARQAAQVARKGGGLSGFLSGAKGVDLSQYTDLEQSFLDILASAETFRFDASDLMPADVGSGTFWTEGTAAVNGDKSVQDAADAIEASWPS